MHIPDENEIQNAILNEAQSAVRQATGFPSFPLSQDAIAAAARLAESKLSGRPLLPTAVRAAQARASSIAGTEVSSTAWQHYGIPREPVSPQRTQSRSQAGMDVSPTAWQHYGVPIPRFPERPERIYSDIKNQEAVAQLPYAHATSRYFVKITEDIKGIFSDVSGLQMETEIFEYAEGGNLSHVHRFPGQTKVGNITLKRGVVRGNELFKWYQRIVNGQMDLRPLTITILEASYEPLITWELQNAFPCKWSGPQFTAGTDVVAVESVEFAHMGVLTVSVSGSKGKAGRRNKLA